MNPNEEEKSRTGTKKTSRSNRNASLSSEDPERGRFLTESMAMDGYGTIESVEVREGRRQGPQMDTPPTSVTFSQERHVINEDVLVKALNLSESFESIASREHEFREQYKTQSKVVQQFAADIVEEAHGDEELRELMDLEGEGTLEARVSKTKQSQEERLSVSDPQWEHKTQRIKSLGLLQMASEKKLKVVGSQ